MRRQRAHSLDVRDPTSRAFDLFAHRRRRALFDVLAAREGPCTVSDLAKSIAVRERDVPIEEVPGEATTRAYLTLFHVHVPKLATAGVVDHDRTRNTVALTERGNRLCAFAAHPGSGWLERDPS